MEQREEELALGVYELGRLQGAVARERELELVEELLEAGILVDDKGRGLGWRLLDIDGVDLMPAPAEELLFADKGHCRVYWMGLGRPHGALMHAISDPLCEEAALESNAQLAIDGDEHDHDHDESDARRRLSLIDGGLDENGGGPPSRGPVDPSREWQLEEAIGDEIEEKLYEEAIDRIDAAAKEVVERWGCLAVDALLDTIESATGVELLAYDDEVDGVIYGGELIGRLRQRYPRLFESKRTAAEPQGNSTPEKGNGM